MTDKELISAALKAMEKAYAPYSGYKVGAALLSKCGKIYTGCNIENASFGLTNCAERTAIFKAVSEGETEFLKIAVVGGKAGIVSDYFYPCGACRQVMTEFCGREFEIITAMSESDFETVKLRDMLPYSFSSKKMKD